MTRAECAAANLNVMSTTQNLFLSIRSNTKKENMKVVQAKRFRVPLTNLLSAFFIPHKYYSNRFHPQHQLAREGIKIAYVWLRSSEIEIKW